MTYEQFQATRKEANAVDLIKADYDAASDLPNLRGFIYANALVIEDTESWEPEYRNKPHLKRYYLMLGNNEYFSDTLETLEERLYHYAVEEGFTA